MIAARKLIAVLVAAVVVALCVCTLAGCQKPPAGRGSAEAAAREFLVAAAAGEVGRAQDVTTQVVTEAGLAPLRKTLFGTVSPLSVTELQLGSGSQILMGADNSVYLVLESYTASGTVRQVDFSAYSQYEIVVAKRGAVWLVVSWTGLAGTAE
jgi:hypothetical protein